MERDSHFRKGGQGRLCEEAICEQRPEWREKVSHPIIWGEMCFSQREPQCKETSTFTKNICRDGFLLTNSNCCSRDISDSLGGIREKQNGGMRNKRRNWERSTRYSFKKEHIKPSREKKENSYLGICLSTIIGKEHLLLRAIHIAELWSSGCLSWDKSCLLIFNQSFAQLLW